MRIFTRHCAIGLICGLLTLIFSLLPLAELAELKGYDILHLFRLQAFPSRNIVIVAIDEPSFAELRLQWPWPRNLHSRLIDSLKDAGASVIALDIVFAEPSLPGEDRLLANAIKRAGNVVMASFIETTSDRKYAQETRIEPLPLFGQYALSGIVTIPIDRDNVVRRFYPVKADETLFAEQAAFLHTKQMRRVPGGAVVWYAGPPRTFDTVSYYQALEPSKFLPPDYLRGKIVIVGTAIQSGVDPERSSADIFATPFLSSGQRGLMSGSEIQANMVNDLLEGQFVIRVAPLNRAILFLLMAVLGSLLQVKWHPVRSALLTLLCLAGYMTVAYYALENEHVWMPSLLMALPLLLSYGAWGAKAYIEGEKKRREIRKAFAHYVSPSVLESVLSHPENLKLGGKKVEATVLFSDIAGFTSIAENMPPVAVAGLLNRYLKEMTTIILLHKGTLDKFIGDGIMAFWGAPADDADHALNACRAALEMQNRLVPLRAELRTYGLPEIEVRIGINTGMVIAGNMGSPDLFDYTVLGDTVNLASRLEGANKQFGTRILISSSVYEKMKGKAEVRPLGKIGVKGRSVETEVYELLAVTD